MPTGYTAALYEGEQSFEEFVWKAARGMGALITMRDMSMDAPIPERFEPSDYHSKEMEKAKARLAEVSDWTLAESQKAARESYEAARDRWEHGEWERLQKRERYEAMLAKVEAWTPPSSDHEGFKEFMVSQLKESIEFDCGSFGDPPTQKFGADFKAKEIEKAKSDIAYHEKGAAEEAERARERTEWVQALRESLAGHKLETSRA